MALEDEFGDVIRKARVGLGLTHEDAGRQAGLSAADLEKAEKYQLVPDEAAIRKLAAALDLKAPALIDMALKRYEPAATAFESLGTTAMMRSDYGGGIVNCYAMWDASSGQGAFFDTGVDWAALEQLQARHGFEVAYLFLTHTHGDHVELVEKVKHKWAPKIIGSKHEPVPGAELLAGDAQFAVGMLNIEAFHTPGHSPGGLSYYIEGFGADRPALCVCGDALFAGSAGGPMHSYAALMNSVRKELLTLGDETILCPGHGPLTTVGQEKVHNPFA